MLIDVISKPICLKNIPAYENIRWHFFMRPVDYLIHLSFDQKHYPIFPELNCLQSHILQSFLLAVLFFGSRGSKYVNNSTIFGSDE